jgi:dihydroorotate dehydrogenase electron transfer subunit
MLHLRSRVLALHTVAPDVFLLSLHCPELSEVVTAGQFVNIRVREGFEPLLRRPFSVYRTAGQTVEILFQRIGKGTALLAEVEKGDEVDLLGPLGHGFTIDDPAFDTAMLVAGGLGVAPLPIATEALLNAGKKVVTLLGARTATLLVTAHLANVHVATDDGSRGLKGTVVDLVGEVLRTMPIQNLRLFACGPTPMLRTLAAVVRARGLDCEVSLEGQMACGIGLCQGCPVEVTGQTRRYALMCKDGPVFTMRDIIIGNGTN